MKDRVFSGPDVDEAVALAAASLGLPRAALRYVVLDPGAAGVRGLKATPAQIAVLLEDAPRNAGPAREPAAQAAPAAPEDPRAGLRATIRAVAEAGALDVDAEVEESAEAVVVRLHGPDASFFIGADGRGEVLRATEHLLHRIYGRALETKTLRLTGDGFRERRDAALAEEARRVAAEVRADGQARTMEPQNAYERRIVHVALQDEPGIVTYSVGQGAGRRVTVAPAGSPAPEARDGGE